jgi:hypothetical protein
MSGDGGRRSFDGVEVFSATKVRERQQLGETITRWLRQHPEYDVVDKVVTQSSDREFHCISVTLFYRVRKSGP